MLDTQRVNKFFQSDKEFFLHKNSQASCVSHVYENAGLNKIKIETLKNRLQICNYWSQECSLKIGRSNEWTPHPLLHQTAGANLI